MDIQGKVLQVLPEQRFNGKNGELVRNSFVIEVANGNYPKRLKFDVLKEESWKKMGVRVGANVQVSFDIDSREWNGKWFTSLNCWRVVTANGNSVYYPNNNQQQVSQVVQADVVTNGVPYVEASVQSNSGNDGLPF